MNKKLVIVAVVAGIALALFTKNIGNKFLPNGLFGVEPEENTTVQVTPEPIPGRPQVELNTSKGKIIIELRPDIAPKTVANFLSKWNSDYCAGKTFHRVEDWVVQGCDPNGDGTGGKLTLPTEVSSETFAAGSVGVARRNTPKESSNDSQFFIVKKDAKSLDGEYTYFGKVISGMDVVNKISAGDQIIGASVLSK